MATSRQHKTTATAAALIVALIAALTLMALTASEASASHFRGGNASWAVNPRALEAS